MAKGNRLVECLDAVNVTRCLQGSTQSLLNQTEMLRLNHPLSTW